MCRGYTKLHTCREGVSQTKTEHSLTQWHYTRRHTQLAGGSSICVGHQHGGVPGCQAMDEDSLPHDHAGLSPGETPTKHSANHGNIAKHGTTTMESLGRLKLWTDGVKPLVTFVENLMIMRHKSLSDFRNNRYKKGTIQSSCDKVRSEITTEFRETDVKILTFEVTLETEGRLVLLYVNNTVGPTDLYVFSIKWFRWKRRISPPAREQ